MENFQTQDAESVGIENIAPKVVNCIPKTTQLTDAVETQQNELKSEIEDIDCNEDLKDVDLSAIEVIAPFIKQALTVDDVDSSATDEANEVYSNIMTLCSSTAQTLKKNITDVLSSRGNIVISAGDSSNELEINLSKRIADFENVVSGCFPSKETFEAGVVTSDVQSIETVGLSETVKSISEDTGNSTSNTQVFVQSNPEINTAAILVNDQCSKENDTDISAANSSLETSVEVTKSCDDKKVDLSQSSIVSDITENISPQVQAETSLKEKPKVQICAEEEKNVKKQQKTHSSKKKGEKTIDQVIKSLSNYATTEGKLQALSKRHVETLEELRLLEPRFKQLERQVSTQQREKEQLQAEHNRMILAKSRLEGLCRELQRQSRAVKEESLLRIREEEEKRKEVANKFQVTLNDISALMQENSKKNIQLREENAELAKKLKSLVDHYEMWEKHMEKVVQQKDLETELAKAKHAKINLLLKQETEKFLREKQSLLENMSELQKKCTLLTANELQLRTELGDYTSKYEEFQGVLNKSSQVFASFKTDMEATSKKIKKLEKETNVYKQKWESSNNALLGMINDKQKHDKELINSQQRVLTLEKLCRALQGERNELQNQVNVLSSGSISHIEKDVPSIPTITEVE